MEPTVGLAPTAGLLRRFTKPLLSLLSHAGIKLVEPRGIAPRLSQCHCDVLLLNDDPNLVGAAGIAPAVFLMWRGYSPLPSLLGYTPKIYSVEIRQRQRCEQLWCGMRDLHPHGMFGRHTCYYYINAALKWSAQQDFHLQPTPYRGAVLYVGTPGR